MKKSAPFRFKQFAVSHSRSSIKVGVDGVLTGALARIYRIGSDLHVGSVLDAGCGCGVIALMIAQRVPEARIEAIDIDPESVEEARENFANSPWSDRLSATVNDFNRIHKRYDLVISNPPFFRSGVTDPDSVRLAARHQGTFSPFALLRRCPELLNPDGVMTFVCPAEFEDEIESVCNSEKLKIVHRIRIRGHADAPIKRIIFNITLREDTPPESLSRPDENEEVSTDSERICKSVSELVLEESPGVPTEEYRALCRDFYLRF